MIAFMKARHTVPVLLIFCALTCGSAFARAEDTNAVQFSLAAPYSSDQDIAQRFGFRIALPEYDVAREKFRLMLPASYSTNSLWGLLVWISPGDDAYVPPDWGPELASHRLILISPYRAGNDRHPVDRMRLALDATCNICRKFRIDRKRIIVGGFSGGARIASMIGVAYGDIFPGTLSICGVNFYKHVASAKGEYFLSSYIPTPPALLAAQKNGRFVLLTGENDPNQDNTKSIYERGFKREGFVNVQYIEVPGMQHALPEPGTLSRALDYLVGPGISAIETAAPKEGVGSGGKP